MFRIFALLIGYVFGCIQTAYFVGRAHGIDIRDHGSKNAGMTNVTRTVGKKWGAFTFLTDLLKGVGVFALTMVLFEDAGVLAGIYSGAGIVLGHCFPFWLKFRGGKGMACTLGVIIMLSVADWRVMAISFAAGLAVVLATRYISLASLVITFLVPILMWFSEFDFEIEAVALMAGVAALIWFLHRENIKRLVGGTERKFLKKSM